MNITTDQIRAHYLPFVQQASMQVLAALLNRDVDTDGPVTDVLEELAVDEAVRRGINAPHFWALTARLGN